MVPQTCQPGVSTWHHRARTTPSRLAQQVRNVPTGQSLARLVAVTWSCGKAGVLGFEPRLTESESVVLPLHHTPRRLNRIPGGRLGKPALRVGRDGGPAFLFLSQEQLE